MPQSKDNRPGVRGFMRSKECLVLSYTKCQYSTVARFKDGHSDEKLVVVDRIQSVVVSDRLRADVYRGGDGRALLAVVSSPTHRVHRVNSNSMLRLYITIGATMIPIYSAVTGRYVVSILFLLRDTENS